MVVQVIEKQLKKKDINPEKTEQVKNKEDTKEKDEIKKQQLQVRLKRNYQIL
ncbi:hypothetical protein [Virgibacillus sp. DJP39]|uniref:hypothetical protein n=1 Tax=Virgibacillus sp. DJP39 TaxID=3409790 RepID=UPI003BB4D47A